MEAALKPTIWDLGNQVLYDLCREHPDHVNPQAIVAKLWLIGRTYAAAIERRRNPTETGDEFYENQVVNGIRNSNIDRWLGSLPHQLVSPWTDFPVGIEVHKKLVDLFESLTGLKKRSLASKYLHFHRPDLFFLYDSRASGTVQKCTPLIQEIPLSHVKKPTPTI